jgi:hypothetical protein
MDERCVCVCMRVRAHVHVACAFRFRVYSPKPCLCACGYVRLCGPSDLSRNKFTKVSVEAAPLLATLYRPNLLVSDLSHSTWTRVRPMFMRSFLRIGRHSVIRARARSREAFSIPVICSLSFALPFCDLFSRISILDELNDD